MPSKARMTIRFEPPVKPQDQTKPTFLPVDLKAKPYLQKDELTIEPLIEPTVEQILTTWNSPYQDDIHALEEIIRKTEKVKENPNPAVRPVRQISPVTDDQLIRLPERYRKDVTSGELPAERWTLEMPEYDQEEHREAGWYNRAANVREEGPGPSWGRVFLSVAAAVGTGALFGYMVLSLFTGEPLFPGKSGTAAQFPVQASPSPLTSSTSGPVTQHEPVSSDSVAGGDEKVGTSVTTSSASQVKADVYYMLQYGVFQNKKSMETAVQQLQEKGLVYASEASEGYRVYVGAARTRDEAKQLAEQMPDTEIYIKPIGGEQLEVPASELSDAGVEFMKASAGLTRKLAQISATGLQEKLPTKLGDVDLASLQEAHQQWLATISAADKINSKEIEDAKTIVQALNAAMVSMTEFNRKPSRSHLWSVQSSVMQALLADRHMRSLIQPEIDGGSGS
ncbi:SPOR domain-containing protein [Cohnella mopanensis]|uniref:SPOR domain-containing protein n=1 Tax=Cohnella mopanensis TaxID=2911966 RepID=UPI001EF83B41|nr:SPOR domain-containing protein [Cohnella mopanensis]